MEQVNKELLEACKRLQKHLDTLIHLTPTGEERNQLTYDNLLILQAISKAENNP